MLAGLVAGWPLAAETRAARSDPSTTSAASARGVDEVPTVTKPGATLRIVRERHYRMSGRIRPLIFWFGRDNVGLGRIVWREGPGGARGYELLVGTDPARAPRGLNRWGFISEAYDGATGSVLALMTRSDERSVEQATAATERRPAGGDLRAIRGSVTAGSGSWRLSSVVTPEPFTVHDLDSALEVLARSPSATPLLERHMPPELQTGFLTAVASALDDVMREVAVRGDPRGLVRRRVGYAFGQRTYDLKLHSATLLAWPTGRRTVRAVKAVFETRNRETAEISTFELISGLDGARAGVPLVIEWQPRWWLKVTLSLEDNDAAAEAHSSRR
jgi:hypothetical protein